MEQENNVENLIKAKGFADCVRVYPERRMQRSGGLLKGSPDTEAITIKDIVAGQTGISFDKIKIVEAKIRLDGFHFGGIIMKSTLDVYYLDSFILGPHMLSEGPLNFLRFGGNG